MASSAPVNADEVASLGRRWYVLIIMMLVYTISIADRYVLSTVLGPIAKEFKLTDTETAWLGIPLALFYVTMGIPLSWLCDRTNRTRLLAASVAIWSAMTAITGYTRGYFDLLLARVGVGIGEAGGTPACNSIIADYFPADRRSMAMTIFALGGSLGAWLGSSFAGTISAEQGWRAAFLVSGHSRNCPRADHLAHNQRAKARTIGHRVHRGNTDRDGDVAVSVVAKGCGSCLCGQRTFGILGMGPDVVHPALSATNLRHG